MPSNKGQGQSGVTHDKQVFFECILRQHMFLTSCIIKKNDWTYPTYYYIDTNAGSGYNDEVNERGSPLIFRSCSHILKIPFKAILIDRHEPYIEELKRRTTWSEDYIFLPKDNELVIPAISKRLYNKGRPVFGLLYHDPNGCPDLTMLKSITINKRLDLLIRFNATAGKRSHNKVRAEDLFRLKDNWILKGPLSSDPWQWSFLLGTNYLALDGWKGIGFHNIKSIEGSEIFRHINFTEKEKLLGGIQI